MTADEFLRILTEKSWKSKGDNTLENTQFHGCKPGDWRYQLIQDNTKYYPPGNVSVEVCASDVTRDEYQVPHGDHTVTVPATVLRTFKLKVTGDKFDGMALMNSARFIVLGDHAISSPMKTKDGKPFMILMRLFETDQKKMIMVNELIWVVQYGTDENDSDTFYDIQKWYCCGLP